MLKTIIGILVLGFMYAGYDAYTIYAYKKAAENANFLSDRIAARTVQRNLIMEAADIRAELCQELKLEAQILEIHFKWYEEGEEGREKSSQANEEYERWKFQQALSKHARAIARYEGQFASANFEKLYRRNERLLEKLR